MADRWKAGQPCLMELDVLNTQTAAPALLIMESRKESAVVQAGGGGKFKEEKAGGRGNNHPCVHRGQWEGGKKGKLSCCRHCSGETKHLQDQHDEPVFTRWWLL